MLKKILLAASISMALACGTQLVSINTTHAKTHVDNVTVYEESIVKNGDHIEVKVLYDGTPHPTIWGFCQINDIWYYGDPVDIELGRGKWLPVSSDKHANNILYIILQYI